MDPDSHGSELIWVAGSGSRRAKLTYKYRESKKFSCFEVLDVLFWGLNASSVACASFGGLGITKLQFFKFLVIKALDSELDPDPQIGKMLDPDPLNKCGSTTLVVEKVVFSILLQRNNHKRPGHYPRLRQDTSLDSTYFFYTVDICLRVDQWPHF